MKNDSDIKYVIFFCRISWNWVKRSRNVLKQLITTPVRVAITFVWKLVKSQKKL